LYCSPEHLPPGRNIPVLTWGPETNIGNELPSIGFPSRLPGFPVLVGTGLRFSQTHIIIFGESHPAGKSVSARDRKTISIAIHRIANLRKQFWR